LEGRTGVGDPGYKRTGAGDSALVPHYCACFAVLNAAGRTSAGSASKS